MSHPEIIIPFALPPAEHAKDLVKLVAKQCGASGLAMLLSRTVMFERREFDDFAPNLPHEFWLSQQHPQAQTFRVAMSRNNLSLTAGLWFLLQPVHLHIASNHCVLTDQRQLELTDSESQILFSIAQNCCAEAGFELVFGDAQHWLLRADDWSDMVTTSPDAACGHNIDIWSPQGSKARAWRKLQNEIQMEWFAHPLQEQRQSKAKKVVNGLWLWSGTQITSGLNIASTPIVKLEAAKQGDNLGLSVDEFIHAPRPTIIDTLTSAALAGDWSAWADELLKLEKAWFSPLSAALRSRKLSQINLVLSNSNSLLTTQTSAGSVRRFWRSANFNQLQNKRI